jgi:vacuolar-type H+-ATPase subunit D/Vma8
VSAHDRQVETMRAIERLVTEFAALEEENRQLRTELRATKARLNSIIAGDEGDAGELFNDSCT